MHIDWTDSPPFGRRVSLISALDMLHERCGAIPGRPYIVEVGTSESYNPDGLGNAILAFAWYVGHFGGRVLSIDAQNVRNAVEILKQYAPTVAGVPQFHLGDAFDFAPTISEPIDLLYMDAGFELASEPAYGAFFRRFSDRIPSFYVELFKRFTPECFQPGALMLFDDTFPDTFKGKGEFLIPYLLDNGWRLVEHFKTVPVFPMVLLEKM